MLRAVQQRQDNPLCPKLPRQIIQVDGLDLRHVQLALDDWGTLRDLYGLFQQGRVLAQDGVTETKTAPAASSRSTSFAKSERERVSRSTL